MTVLSRFDHWLARVTRRWWFYVIILFLFFIPTISAQPVDTENITELILEILPNALIYSAPPAVYIAAKVVPILLVIGLFTWGRGVMRWFNLYAALISLLIGVFQTMAVTPTYGFAVMTGSVVVYTLVALFFVREAFANQNSFGAKQVVWWRCWVLPVAFFAFWMPVNVSIQPDFNPLLLFTNAAGLTYCMVTPLLLALYMLFYPQVNAAVLRVASFAGLVTGLLNLLVHFVMHPEYRWMGVLHLPLVVLSIYGLVLGLRHSAGKKEMLYSVNAVAY